MTFQFRKVTEPNFGVTFKFRNVMETICRVTFHFRKVRGKPFFYWSIEPYMVGGIYPWIEKESLQKGLHGGIFYNLYSERPFLADYILMPIKRNAHM